LGANNDLFLGVGNISMNTQLGAYYQDLTPALYHVENNSIGEFDKNGIPYLVEGERRYYSVVYIIQYGLILHDLSIKGIKADENKQILLKLIDWLTGNCEEFKDSIVWRSEENTHYHLKKGWISAMYQGQAISFFLRMSQLFNEPKYIEFSEKIFAYFRYDYNEGGAKRIDANGYLWFEEYPTNPPSYVFNGFVYTIFGILDYFRVTKNEDAKLVYDKCISTLTNNIHKYDLWYWSRYDQLKQELVSYYYQKNVHIPLVKILYLLTENPIFNTLEIKWEKQLNSRFNRIIVKIMYRIQPRLKKIRKKLS
jgi:heparosan-N-sulfate-glucuronate 5-epimerase